MTVTIDGKRAQVVDPDFRPDCTVRYDEWAGCGVNVLRRADADRVFVELTFLTRRGIAEPHYVTLAQVEQLRAALDAVTRTDPPVYELGRRAGEEVLTVSADAAVILAAASHRRTGAAAEAGEGGNAG